MLDARFSHLYFYQSLNRLQRGLSAIAELLVFSGDAFFFPQKVDDCFSFLVVVITFKPSLNVQTSNQRRKYFADNWRPRGGGPSHGTTGTMVNPALRGARTQQFLVLGCGPTAVGPPVSWTLFYPPPGGERPQ